MSAQKRLARYFTRVYAMNRHAGYGTPVEVIAASKQEAINRAVDIGWAGRPEHARVRVDRVVDLDHRSVVCFWGGTMSDQNPETKGSE